MFEICKGSNSTSSGHTLNSVVVITLQGIHLTKHHAVQFHFFSIPYFRHVFVCMCTYNVYISCITLGLGNICLVLLKYKPEVQAFLNVSFTFMM
jgi:hypothetical protein